MTNRVDMPGTFENQRARLDVLQSVASLLCSQHGDGLPGQRADDWNEQGQIAAPGKFENETIATLYFYNDFMNGGGEAFYFGPGDSGVHVFAASVVERDVLGGNINGLPHEFYEISEDDSGFVFGQWITAARKERIEQEAMEAADRDSEND